MLKMKLFKKFLMPCGLCAAVPAVKPASPPGDCPVNCSNEKKQLVRPSELPIYSIDDTCTRGIPCRDGDREPNFLEEGFGTVRRTIQGFINQYSSVTNSVTDKFNTGVAHSQQMVEYFREESNVMPRLGAIGIGGLTGLILGLRGGTVKRLLYTSTGALTVAAVCYPRQAEEGVEVAKHYANIGYNFVYGVKPGDPDQLEIKWPEFPQVKVPTSLSEFVDLAVATGSTVVTTVGSVASKATEIISEKKEDKTPGDSKKD